MNVPIDISPGDLETVREILAKHVPEHEVLAFGSRVTWTARQYSDLDLAVMTEKPLDISCISDLSEAFTQSDLPFQVDIVDWAGTSENFRKIIEKEHAVVQQRIDQRKLDEWQKFTIGEIAEVVGGGTPSTKNPENFDGSMPWITPKDLSGPHDRYIGRGKRNLSQRGLENSSAKLLPSGSILLSTRAPIGYVALAKNPIATNQGFRSLVVKKGFSQEYLYYWLIQNTEELKRHASGSTFQELSGSALKTISLYLPPFPEQHAIAHILGTLDDKIELNRQMSETLEAMAQALFKSWFVDFDPVRAKMEGRWHRGESLPGLPADLWDLFPNKLVDSELGKIPDGWKPTPLGKRLAELVSGSRPKGGSVETGIPSIGAENVIGLGHYDFSKEKYIPAEFFEKLKIKKANLQNGDVLLYKDGAKIGRKTYFDQGFPHSQCAVNEHVFILRMKRPELQMYLFFWLDQSWVTQEIISLNSNSAQPGINQTGVKSLPILLPTLDVILSFDRNISQLMHRLFSNCLESRHLSIIRDTLLPKLVNGELPIHSFITQTS